MLEGRPFRVSRRAAPTLKGSQFLFCVALLLFFFKFMHDLLARFSITEKGLMGLYRAFQYLPWTMIVGFKIEDCGDHLILTVPECPTQVARVRHKLPEFQCRDMHHRQFESFAHAIDPAIKVECLLAPPDHPPELFCKWRFSLTTAREAFQ